jgi:hypothetical protein
VRCSTSNNLGLLNGSPFFFAEIFVRRIAAGIAKLPELLRQT